MFLRRATAGASERRLPLRQATSSVYVPGSGGVGNEQVMVCAFEAVTVATAATEPSSLRRATCSSSLRH